MDATGLPAALSRSAVLLEAAARHDGLLFQDALTTLGAVPSTVSRLLRALTTANLLVHSEDGRYRAAPLLHRLAGMIVRAPDLAGEAAAAVASLSAATGESAAVFVPIDEGIKVMAKHEPDERFRFMPIGGINSKPHEHGVCMLRAAYWDEKTARRHYAAVAPGKNPTPWLRRLREVRRKGWIANDIDDQLGIGRMAATVLDLTGEAAAFICVAGTTAALTASHDHLLREVRLAAAEFTTRLAGRPS
jgi:DNA-binding IclR family transcriptional regulator